jgi:ketosteroid isomerase-like protein
MRRLPFLVLIFFTTAARAQTASDDVSQVLDAFHKAASEADFDGYFGLFAENAVFMGTDATERWPVEVFKDYTRARFEDGGGWTYQKIERNVFVAADGKTAWFDEMLTNANMGLTRGTGVLIRTEDAWKVAQYNLTVPVPNELARDLVARIRALDGDR